MTQILRSFLMTDFVEQDSPRFICVSLRKNFARLLRLNLHIALNLNLILKLSLNLI